MSYKVNADCRHYVPKQRNCIRNLSEYDAVLRQRGSLTVWFTDKAVERW